MTGKDLLLATLQHEPVPRVPWMPFAGVHAGKLKGYSAIDVLKNADKLVESLLEVNTRYRPDGQLVFFDLQVEAEILGCDLIWNKKRPPTVAQHLFATRRAVPAHLPQKTDGRLPIILEAMRRVKSEIGKHTALYGLVCGPLMLASHLRGPQVFKDMVDAPAYVHGLIAFCARLAERIAEYYVEAGMDVIAMVDPLVSRISPEHFRAFLATAFFDCFATLRRHGAFSSFFACGDATRNIEEMCKTGPDAIFIDENVDMPAVKQITDRYNIALGGNIPLSTIMRSGTRRDNMKYVIDLLDAMNHHNLVIAPGCDMPYDTPIENVESILQAVHDPEGARRMLAT